ncbi:hypothetical protein J4E85_010202 [Alternaria conjuncta]|uniref:uncharacterized protein n=1 Tax=Alternaria conjuncta TaxID=181017 RepID=UPI00221E8BAE|nr:uncharacterized protein J4E85_010202 [Alternaria conjuncta]KAI4916546.1 hypothetical protein J4E85_010202 [Alternaria conjuncta]
MASATPFRDDGPTLEATEAELSRLLSEEISVQTELDKFKSKVAELEIRRTNVGKECHHLTRIVAEKLCRKFVDKFHTTLPPELREMVYDYVWDEPMLRLVFHDVTLNEKTSNTRGFPRSRAFTGRRVRDKINLAPWSVPCRGDSCRCFHWWELPLWVQHQYVGMDVAVEVAKAYYRNMSGRQLNAYHLHELTDFLSEDHFHLGVKPLDHIRRLELSLEEYAFLQDEGQMEHSIQTKNGQDIFQHCFEGLLDVRVKKGFHLTIKLQWDGDHIYCMPALERSLKVVHTLMKEGAKVTVLAFEMNYRKEYNVSDYYALSQEDWQAKWIKRMRKALRLQRRPPASLSDSMMAFIHGHSGTDIDILDEDLVGDSQQDRSEDDAFVRAMAGLKAPPDPSALLFPM